MELRPVLIAGGGIAGLAAAVALRRRGISATVLERRADAPDSGLGLNLPGNAIVALHRLGLGQELERLGTPTRRREYRTERGTVMFAIDEIAYWGADAQPRCVLRGDLLGALRRALPGSTTRLGVEVRDVRVAGDRVESILSGGEVATGAVLVGADGVHSTIRDRVTRAHAPRAAVLSRASWRFVTHNLGVDCWTSWTGAAGTAVFIPVGGDRLYGWLGAPGEDGDFAETAAAFDRFPRLVRDTLASALAERQPPFRSPLEEVRPPVWPSERIVLIGDAAHATAPVWAQGAALAVEDALALAEVLAGLDNWARAGAEVAQRRRDRVAHVQRMTDRMSRAARLPSWLRDRVAPRIGPRSYRATYDPLRLPLCPT